MAGWMRAVSTVLLLAVSPALAGANPAEQYRAGLMLLAHGRPDLALGPLQEAAILKPKAAAYQRAVTGCLRKAAEYHARAARAHAAAGRWIEAERDCQRALELGTDSPGIAALRAEAQQRNGVAAGDAHVTLRVTPRDGQPVTVHVGGDSALAAALLAADQAPGARPALRFERDGSGEHDFEMVVGARRDPAGNLLESSIALVDRESNLVLFQEETRPGSVAEAAGALARAVTKFLQNAGRRTRS